VSLALAPEILASTFEVLRSCGKDRAECVAYWVGPLLGQPEVDEVVHPLHTSSPTGYEVDGAWVTEFFLDLHRDGRTTRAQVHTHPGRAGHSSTDDTFALVSTPGFLSLVIPRFAAGRIGLEGSVLMEMDSDGRWVERHPVEVLR
jgi:hypothetical protein